MSKISISIQHSNAIRGLAIIAVILVHALAYFPGIYNSNKQLFFIVIDQWARFCVPAFIILSGYGLAAKYEGREIHYLDFLKRRIGKMLPLYLLWSLAAILIIKSVPAWSYGNQPMSLVIQLLFGQADYQLYFVSVLLQLYCLFPLIWRYRNRINLILFMSLLAQTVLYLFFAQEKSNSDRFQYALSLSWIFYFVLGIYLKLKGLPKLLLRAMPVISLLSLSWITLLSTQQINHGLDPLPALKFTRLPIVIFSSSFCLSLYNWQKYHNKVFNWLGQNSYLIFLAHTIAMRIIYALVTNQLAISKLATVFVYWSVTFILSLLILKYQQNTTVRKK